MAQSKSTCWTVIREAAAGDAGGRDKFARRYAPVLRAYLTGRWKRTILLQEVEDAVNAALLDCFLRAQKLGREGPNLSRGLCFFLHDVVSSVARGFETRRLDGVALQELAAARDPEHSRQTFSEAWTGSMIREAIELQEEWARGEGEAALRRGRLNRLLYQERKTFPEIEREWEGDADLLREYGRAARELKDALTKVMEFHHPGTATAVAKRCADLLASLRPGP